VTTMAPTFVLPFPKMYLFWFSMDLYLNNYGVHSTQTLLPVSLATRIRANSVQAGGHCLPSSSRHCSSINICPTYCVALLTYRQDVVFDRRSLIVLTSVVRPTRLVTVGDRSFLRRDAMHKRGLCRHAVSVCVCVCVSVTFVDHFKTNKHILATPL